MEDRIQALGEIAADALRRMVREILARRPGGHLVESTLATLDLRLPIALRADPADAEAASADLTSRLERLVDDAIEAAAVFRPGRAFCHRCRGVSCDHSEPPSARHVFVSYAPTGAPVWEDFAQACLEIRHPEVDRLFGDPPAFVTLVDDARVLRSRLLGAFEAPAYRLLGQVRAGFFQVPAREEEGRGVLAVTFQAAGARSRSGRLRLGLNILGRMPGGGALDLLWERGGEVPWTGAVRWAQAALVSAARARGGRTGDLGPAADEDLDRRVTGILRGLARRLDRDRRSRARRTLHANERHLSGDRPTRKAVDDIRGARAEEVLLDERNGTLVIFGDRGRVHFFTADGRLVSSVRYSRDAIERKRKLGLWRDARGDEAEALLARLRGEAFRTAAGSTEGI